MPDWVPDDLPAAAGVYRFQAAHGETLYVGKSVDLRRRVRGYFYGGGPSDARLAEMLRLARAVRIRRTGSELEARLEEAERILEERPPYNKALKRRWRAWYLEVPWSEPFPRLRVVRRPRRAGSRYLGPFPGRRSADRCRRLAEKAFRLRTCRGALRPDPRQAPCLQHGLGLCTAPCAKRVGLEAYRAQVRAAARLLRDRDWAVEVRARAARARDAAAERLDFEAAADLQRRIAWLDELEELRWLLDGRPGDGSWLIVLPDVAPERRVLLPVARGRPLGRRAVEAGGGDWEAGVKDALYAIGVAELRGGGVLRPGELVPAYLVARWIRAGASGGVAVRTDGLDARALLDRLAAAA